MNRFKASISMFALFTPAFLAIAPLANTADLGDCDHVNQLLAESKAESFHLRQDAAKMASFGVTDLSRESHLSAITEINGHIHVLSNQLAKMEEMRGCSSTWQNTAMDTIKPLLKELAANTEATITYLNRKPNGLKSREYRTLLDKGGELADRLSATTADYADYGQTLQRLQQLRHKLELPATGE